MHLAARLGRQARGIAGVAPVLHFPSASTAADQKSVNTQKYLEVLRAQLGEKPEAYTRKHSATFDEIKAEVDSVLSSCGSNEAPLEEGKEVTQIQVIERVLRHGLCQYAKNEGECSYEDMEKWLVYTPQDQMELNKLKRDVESAEKRKAFAAGGGVAAPLFNWAAEYENAIDRELVSEKRKRYDQVAATNFDRDEAAIEAELELYKRPQQEATLDRLVEQIILFKPFLAKEVINAKLIERNADGQLSFSRFADYNPDARDVAEVEAATIHLAPGDAEEMVSTAETEKRYSNVRMKTKEEIVATMEGVQQANSSSVGAATGGGNSADEARRAKMLAEIVRLQSRSSGDASTVDASGETITAEEREAEAERERIAFEKEMEKYKVSDSVVDQKGLLGLNFMGNMEKAASA